MIFAERHTHPKPLNPVFRTGRASPIHSPQSGESFSNVQSSVSYQNAFMRLSYSGIQRTGGLAWIWRQPPKLQAEGSNPSLFAILLSKK